MGLNKDDEQTSQKSKDKVDMKSIVKNTRYVKKTTGNKVHLGHLSLYDLSKKRKKFNQEIYFSKLE